MTPTKMKEIIGMTKNPKEPEIQKVVKKLGVTSRTFRRWLNGESNIPLSVIKHLELIESLKPFDLRDINIKNRA